MGQGVQRAVTAALRLAVGEVADRALAWRGPLALHGGVDACPRPFRLIAQHPFGRTGRVFETDAERKTLNGRPELVAACHDGVTIRVSDRA